MPNPDDKIDSTAFRQAIIDSFKQDRQAFDLYRLQNELGASEKVVRRAAKTVFLSQCIRASVDGVISTKEQDTLSKLAEQLCLSQDVADKCLTNAKDHVFLEEWEKALADGVVTKEEAERLNELRETLKLPVMERNDYGPNDM